MSGHWRVGNNKLGRSLYKGEQFVGVVDTKELAQEIVQKMNGEVTIEEAAAAFEREIKGASGGER